MHDNKRHIGVLSIETKQLVEYLATIPVGEVASYASLSAVIDRNVQGAARSALESARRVCEREYNAVFGTVTNVGLKHLTDTETIGTAIPAFNHIRRTMRKTARRITSLKQPDTVSEDTKVKQRTYLSAGAALVHMTQQRQLVRLEGKVQKAAKELPLAKTLEAFKD